MRALYLSAVGTMAFLSVSASTDSGYATDPCGYFDFALGSQASKNSGLFPQVH